MKHTTLNANAREFTPAMDPNHYSRGAGGGYQGGQPQHQFNPVTPHRGNAMHPPNQVQYGQQMQQPMQQGYGHHQHDGQMYSPPYSGAPPGYGAQRVVPPPQRGPQIPHQNMHHNGAMNVGNGMAMHNQGRPMQPQMLAQQQLQQQQMPPPMPQRAPAALSGMPTPMPEPTYMVPKPEIILVFGNKKSGKSTVARAIAKFKGYACVPDTDADDGEAQQDDAETGDDPESSTDLPRALLIRLRQIEKALSERGIKGLVVDDALVESKFDIYYIDFIIREKGFNIGAIVVVNSDLPGLIKRNISFTPAERAHHPDPYEVAFLTDKVNRDANIVFLNADEDDASMEALLAQALDAFRNSPPAVVPIHLPAPEFFDGCKLVDNYRLRDRVLELERKAVGVDQELFGFTYVEPNFLLEYSDFSRNALLFRSYKIVPYLWGDKVSLIYCEDKLYISLPSYRLVFEMEPPSEFAGLITDFRSTSTSTNAQNVLFSLEAVHANHKLYITDMMLLGEHRGSECTLEKRIALLKDAFSSLSDDSPIKLVDFYNVNEAEKCHEAYNIIGRGFIFVNPDVLRPGSYEERNFLFPWADSKRVQVQLWDGQFVDDQWIFSALALENTDDEESTEIDVWLDWKVVIPDALVNTESSVMNDGNVVECVLTTIDPAVQKFMASNPSPNGNGKSGGKKPAPKCQFQLRFIHRCEFKRQPLLSMYVAAMLTPTVWAEKKLIPSCKQIEYFPPDDTLDGATSSSQDTANE